VQLPPPGVRINVPKTPREARNGSELRGSVPYEVSMKTAEFRGSSPFLVLRKSTMSTFSCSWFESGLGEQLRRPPFVMPPAPGPDGANKPPSRPSGDE
jgi:hypothetical protein